MPLLPRIGSLCAVLVALAGLPARAAERWITVEPTADSVKSLWKEGTVKTEREMGKSFVRIGTDGKTNPTLAAVQGGAPIDANHRFVKVLLRVQGVENLAGIELRVSSDSLKSQWYSYTIPLYGDLEYDFLQDGEWAAVTMPLGASNATGTPNRGGIDSLGVMVADKGKGGSVQLDFGGWSVVDEPPEGVVSFTFDDGYKEHVMAAKLLKEHGWAGTMYVIPQTIGQPAYMTLEDLAELQRLGSDVAAHDDPPFTQVPPNELEPRLRGIQSFLVEHGYALGAQHLAYPLGKQETRRVRPTVANLFATARLAGSGPETIPPADPHLLRAYNVMSTTKPSEVAEAVRRARDNHEWLILMLHWLPEKTAKPTDYALADFKQVLEEVAKSGIRVAPITEVWKQIASPPSMELAKHAQGASAPASPAP